MGSEQTPRWTLPAGALAFVAAGSALACGSRFDLDPFDSAELALVAVTRGLGHPPGQPLHTALGWLLTRGPWPPLVVLALLSIVPAALMLAVAGVHGLSASSLSPRPLAGVLAATLTALLACALPAVREVCSRVEVYALAALLSVVAVYQSARRARGADWGAGVLIGLAAATNPVVAAQAIGAVFVTVKRAGIRGVARLSAGTLLGLGPFAYAYLVRDRAGTVLVWGAPHTPHDWLRLLTAQDFQHNVSLSVAAWTTNLAHLGWDLTRTGTLPFTLLGVYALWKRDTDRALADSWAVLAALVVGMLMISANVPYRARNPDYGGYLLVPLALACAGIARICVRDSVRTSVLLVGLGAAAIAGFVSAVASRPAGTTRALATAVLQEAPRDAIVVLSSDHLLFPALYIQQVERVRPDLTILNPGWASSSWAWRFAQGHDPSLRVDLTPGIGRAERLAGVLRSRRPGRAIVSESVALLVMVAPQGICPRGLLWSSSEGCGDSRGTIDRVVGLLADQWRRGNNDGWDRATVEVSGETLGDGALALGCPGLALRYFAASIASTLPLPGSTRGCDGRHIAPMPPTGLLEIDEAALRRDIQLIVNAP